MNRRSTAITIQTAAAAALVAGSAAAAEPQGQQAFPWFEKRAASALLFEAADRQSALAEQLQSDGAQRYTAFAGAPRLHFGALPDTLTLLDPLGPLINERSRRYLSSAEFEKKMGRAIGVVTIGLLRESGPAAERNTALALRARPTTAFTSLSMGYALTPRSSLLAMASYGKTEGYGTPDSLMAQVSSLRTVAFSVGWSTRQIFDSHDRVALTVSVPARVRTGAAQGNSGAPYSSYVAGQAFGVATLNLQPTAVERDLELGYTTMMGKHKDGKGGKLTAAVMLRVNPGHDANARPDLLTGIRYSYGF